MGELARTGYSAPTGLTKIRPRRRVEFVAIRQLINLYHAPPTRDGDTSGQKPHSNVPAAQRHALMRSRRGRACCIYPPIFRRRRIYQNHAPLSENRSGTVQRQSTGMDRDPHIARPAPPDDHRNGRPPAGVPRADPRTAPARSVAVTKGPPCWGQSPDLAADRDDGPADLYR